MPKVGIVCEDLHNRGYTLRLLFVPVDHMPCGEELEADRESARVLLEAVAAVCLPDLRINKYDLENHDFDAHWHAQACLNQRD